MDVSLELIPQILAQYPLALVAIYCFVWMLPRSMSIVLGFATGALIAYSLWSFPEQHSESLHRWLLFFDIKPTAELLTIPESYRDQVERAYSRGYYHALVSVVVVLVVLVPFFARVRVNEAISNIGRRPPSGPLPKL